MDQDSTQRGSQNDPSTDVPSGAADSPRGSGPRRWRWVRRIGLALVLLIVAAVAIGPTLAGKWLRGEIERQANERVNGRVTLGTLTLSLNGKARLAGLVVEDAAGQLVARIPEARLDVGMRSLLTGKRDVSAVLTDAEIELVRDAEGKWNLDGLMVPVEDDGGADDKDGEGKTLPELDIHGRVEMVNATVTLRSPDTVLTLRNVAFGAGLDGNKRGLTIESSASLFGGEGSVGDFGLNAIVWPKAGEGAELTALTVTALDLGAVQEAMLLVGAPLDDGSELRGKLSLSARGSLARLDPESAFEMLVEGNVKDLFVDLRSDGLETMKFDDSNATMKARASRAQAGAEPSATAELSGRGGKLDAVVRWDGAADVGLVADVRIDGLKASAGLEPLLARVHPVFATAQAVEGAAVDALVTSQIDVKYAAPLSLAQLKAGWAALPKEPLQGTGSLAVAEGLVETSPFFRQVLETFGRPANPTFHMKPLGFAVDGGRIKYTNPWTWTIEGTETKFAGSVGLGGDLDLRWVVPVTGGLAKQNRIFEAMAGETFEVALGGTLTKPTFNLAGALSTLAQNVARRELEQRVETEKEKLKEKLEKEARDALGGDASKVIDDLLGGKVPVKSVEEAAKGILSGTQGAEELLKSANTLWDEGKRQEASVLYQKIRKDYPFSPTYLIHKKRIKERANG